MPAMVAINSNVILPIRRGCVCGGRRYLGVYMGNNEVSDHLWPARLRETGSSASLIHAQLALKTMRMRQINDGPRSEVKGSPPAKSDWAAWKCSQSAVQVMYTRMVCGNDSFSRNLLNIVKDGKKEWRWNGGEHVAVNLKNVRSSARKHARIYRVEKKANGAGSQKWNSPAESGREERQRRRPLVHEEAADDDQLRIWFRNVVGVATGKTDECQKAVCGSRP